MSLVPLTGWRRIVLHFPDQADAAMSGALIHRLDFR
jgi:hypothetical protein